MNTSASLWARRVGGFFFVVLELCALGGLLGALAFLAVGKLAGSHKGAAELIVNGAKAGSFFFLVWAPGFALVRMFMRAAREKQASQKAPGGNDAETRAQIGSQPPH